MSIPEAYSKNFETLQRATINGHLALVECTDVKTQEPVYTICAMQPDGDGYLLVPLAKMFDGDPYVELVPPS